MKFSKTNSIVFHICVLGNQEGDMSHTVYLESMSRKGKWMLRPGRCRNVAGANSGSSV